MKIFLEKNSKKTNWYYVHKTIFKLQTRIVKQLKKKNFRGVRNLQRLLVKSFASQLLISQKLIHKNNINKFRLYKKNRKNLYLNGLNLNSFIQLQNYKIFNKDSKNSLIVLYFKFLELLWVIAYIPVNETLSDPLSYNDRLYRTQIDILKELYSTLNFKDYKWLLIIKPTGFFQTKNKEWLKTNILLEKKVFKSTLENEKFANLYRKYYKNKEIIESKKISLIKLIKSSCFYGFAKFKKQNLPKLISLKINRNKLFNAPIIYYSGIVFIPGNNLVELKILYKLIFQFLNKRGLVIKKNRIWVINLLYGFNFLGWSIQKEKSRVTITISRENIKSHQLDIKKFLKSAKFLPIDKVIVKLNEKITNWQYYYSYTPYTPNLYKIGSEMNYYLFWRIWRWCKKRHKNKGAQWLYNRYWFYNEKNKWVFHTNRKYLKKYKLNYLNLISLPSSINTCEMKNWKTSQDILLMRMTNMKNFKY